MKAKMISNRCGTSRTRTLCVRAALLAAWGLAMATGVSAQSQPPCPTGTTNCSSLFLGDVNTPSSAANTLTTSSQSGVSSASNASGNTISPSFDNRAQTTQTATNTTTGTISGGNTNSSATGGSATGNLSTNDNRSSVGNTSAINGPISNTNSTGPSTSSSSSGGNVLGSNSGGNTLSTGAATATNGPNTNTNRGGNTTSSNTNTANGGAGGAGGAGGTGGSASSNGTNLGINGQQQGIDRSGNSANANTVSGGAQTNRSAQDASTRSGSNNAISVDAADRSATVYEGDKTIFIPPIVPPTPPSTLAVGNIVKETTACGPLQQVLKTPINGKFFGLITSEDVPQGFTYDLAPVFDSGGNPMTYSEVPLADGSGYRLIGNQAIIFATVVGTSNARNLALGGGGSGGSWGQGGTGTSAANQQLVTNIQLKACDVGTVRRVVAMAPRPLPIIPPPAE
jgi:hypothetical protein